LPRRRLKRPSKIVQNPRSLVDRELSKLDLAHEPKKRGFCLEMIKRALKSRAFLFTNNLACAQSVRVCLFTYFN